MRHGRPKSYLSGDEELPAVPGVTQDAGGDEEAPRRAVGLEARRVPGDAGVRPRHGVLVQPAGLVDALAQPHHGREPLRLLHAAVAHVGEEQPAGVGPEVDDRDPHARTVRAAPRRAARIARRLAVRHIGGAAAVVAPGVGDLREDRLAERVAGPGESVGDVRVQAFDREDVAHAADAGRERGATVDHRQPVARARDRPCGRRSRRRRPPPSARAPARRPRAASTPPRRRRSPVWRRRRPAWGRCSRRASGTAGPLRRTADPRPRPGTRRGSAPRRRSWRGARGRAGRRRRRRPHRPPAASAALTGASARQHPSRAPQWSSVRHRSSMRSRTEIEASTGGVAVLKLVSTSLPGRPLITKSWVFGGHQRRVRAGALGDVRLGDEQVGLAREGGVVQARRLQLGRRLLVAVLLPEEVTQRRDVERGADEDQREQREPTEVRTRRVAPHACGRAARLPRPGGRCCGRLGHAVLLPARRVPPALRRAAPSRLKGSRPPADVPARRPRTERARASVNALTSVATGGTSRPVGRPRTWSRGQRPW